MFLLTISWVYIIYSHYDSRGIIMLDKSYEENNPVTDTSNLEDSEIICRMQYIMSFGEYNIQYDFNLN